MTRRRLSVALVAMLLVGTVAGCGGGGSDTPTSPTPAPTPAPPSLTMLRITVTLSAQDIVAGQTTSASATAIMSDGSSQLVTTGFQSDVPSVATVSDNGTITGVSNGRANIFVVSGGVLGLKQVRVWPRYQGAWTGGATVTLCTDSGQMSGFCDVDYISVGDRYVIAMTATQVLRTVTVSGSWAGVTVPVSTVQIAEDGSLAFSGRGDLGDYSFDETWRLNPTSATQLNGTIVSVLTLSRVTGGVTYTSSIDFLTSGSPTAGSAGLLVDTGAVRQFLARTASPAFCMLRSC